MHDDGRSGVTFEVSADRIRCMADEGVELGHIEFHQLTPDTVDIIHTFVEPAGRTTDRKSVV